MHEVKANWCLFLWKDLLKNIKWINQLRFFFVRFRTTRLISDFIFPLEIETRGWISQNISAFPPSPSLTLFSFSMYLIYKNMIILLFIASSFYIYILNATTLSVSDIIQLFLVFFFFFFSLHHIEHNNRIQWIDIIYAHIHHL